MCQACKPLLRLEIYRSSVIEIRMGSGDWFKTIISGKKVKADKSKKPKGSSASDKNESKAKGHSGKNNTGRNNGTLARLSEDVAATRIQTAFRAYVARKTVRRMKGVQRFKKLMEVQYIRKQSTSTLVHLHSWSRIQAEIRDRRLSMVIEGRLKQKKLENQMKLDAKLHDLEVEWNGGFDTMEEILARIHQREEASVKRERTLAYAFSHQWRPNSCQNHGSDASELGKANWGWSWKERWIAARPWESRVPSQFVTPKKCQNKPKCKAGKSGSPLTTQKFTPPKSGLSNGNASGKARRLSFSGAEKQAEQNLNPKTEEVSVMKSELVL